MTYIVWLQKTYQNSKFVAIRAVLLNERVKVSVLLSVGAKSGYINDQQNLSFVLRQISKLSFKSLNLEVIDRLIGCFTSAPSGSFVNKFGT